MPSLNEYVSTLKKHNPKAEDRLLKIYLLKAGWPIADIEKAFGEYYAGPKTEASPVATVAPIAPAAPAAPVASAAPTPIAATPVAARSTVAAPVAPAQTAAPKTEIEIAAPEIQEAHPTPISTAIPVPSYMLEPTPEPVISIAPIAASATSPNEALVAGPVSTMQTVSVAIPGVTAPVTVMADIEVASKEPMGGFLSPFPNTTATTAAEIKEPEYALPLTKGDDGRSGMSRVVVPSETAAIDSGILLKTPTVASIEVLNALAEGDHTKIPGDPEYVVPDIERDLATPHGNAGKISTAPSEHVFVPTSANAPVQNMVYNAANTAGVTSALDQKNLYSGEHGQSNQTEAIRQQIASAHMSNTMSGAEQNTGPSMMPGVAGMSGGASYASIVAGMSQNNSSGMSQTGAKQFAAAAGDMQGPVGVMNPAFGSAPAIAPKKKSRVGLKIFLWLIILLVLGGLAYGYLRFVHGVYVFVKEPIGRDEVLSYIADSISELETAEYTTHLTIQMGSREPGSESLDLDSIGLDAGTLAMGISPFRGAASSTPSASAGTSTESAANASGVQDFLAAFPVDGVADITIQSFYERNKESDDSQLRYIGKYMGEGIKADVDIESVVKDHMTFVKANEFPEMLFDITPVKGKWVSIDSNDEPLLRNAFPWLSLFAPKSPAQTAESTAGATSTDIALASSSPASNSSMAHLTRGLTSPHPANIDQQIARLISIASDERVLKVVGDPIKTVESGSTWYEPKRVIYQYKIQPDLSQFLAFVDRANVILQNEFGTSSILALTEEQKAEIHGPAFAKFFEYFTKNGGISMAVDKDRAFVGMNFFINLISESKRMQINGDISLDNINRRVSIEKPKADISFKDAYAQISGQSAEMIMLKDKVRVVEAIRAALAEYQAAHAGALPDNLMDLLADPAGIKAFAAEPGLDDKNLLNNYQYKKVLPAKNSKAGAAAGYQLAYQIKLPPLPEQFYELHENLIGFDATTAASTDNDRSLQYLKFVNGKNTATDKSLSLEADATKRLDSDKDLLTNGLEQYIGTNITKKDTDGDGTGDYDELKKGGNPLGAGSWTVENKPK